MNIIFIGKQNVFIRFHFFRIIAEFEVDDEIDTSSTGNKITKIYKQNPVCIAYYMVSELDDKLKSGYYESPLGYDNVDWFVDEVIKIDNKMVFYFKNTKEDVIMSEKDDEAYGSSKICPFCEKEKIAYKVRHHCHLTGK